ncbi:MAG: cytochrome c [Acidobacteria bacterium]|nr:cytochrome c [Acidobacteriota bacterium]
MKRALVVVLLVAGVGVVVARIQTPPLPNGVRLTAGDAPSNAVERGRLVYRRYGCATCHGVDGKGGFPNQNAETDGKVPAVIYVAEGYTDRELRQRLLDGTPTVGKADAKGPRPPYRMPGWRAQMTDREVDDLVQYLKSLYPKSAGEKWR